MSPACPSHHTKKMPITPHTQNPICSLLSTLCSLLSALCPRCNPSASTGAYAMFGMVCVARSCPCGAYRDAYVSSAVPAPSIPPSTLHPPSLPLKRVCWSGCWYGRHRTMSDGHTYGGQTTSVEEMMTAVRTLHSHASMHHGAVRSPTHVRRPHGMACTPTPCTCTRLHTKEMP